MKISLTHFLTLIPFLFPTGATAASDLPTTTPTEAGFSADKIKAAKEFAESSGSPAGIVLHKGKVLFSWGDVTRKYPLYSGRKSLLSALIGIAVKDEKIDLSKTLQELKIDDIAPVLTFDEKQAKVSDLLKARSGVYHTSARESAAMKEKRPERGSHSPGSFFYYNNWDFNTLGTIYEKQTKQTVGEGFLKLIATPIGMQDFVLTDFRNAYEKSLSQFPAATFNLSARDFARFGLLYLQKGRWEQEQIVPSAWVEESTTSYSEAGPPSGKGYGYMWWVGTTDGNSLIPGANLGKGAFSAEGHGGQYLVVSPKHELVVVSFAKEENANEARPPLLGPKLGQFLSKILDAKLN